MPAYVSPGVYVIEKDWSDYSPSLNSTSVGVIGFASQGPVGKATLVTNADQLVQTFGRPDDAEGGFGLIGAYHILDRTNTVYFTRCATVSASVADAAVKVGACPHVGVTGLSPNKYYLFLVSVTDGAGVSKTTNPLIFNCSPASANTSLSGGSAAVDAEVNLRTTPTSPVSFTINTASAGDFVGSYAGSGATCEVYAWESASAFGTIPAGTTNTTVTAFSGTNADLAASTGNFTVVGNNGTADISPASGVTSSGIEFVLTDTLLVHSTLAQDTTTVVLSKLMV